MGGTVMLVGTGHLGGPILDRLVANPHVGRVVAVGREARRGEARCNLARLAAVARGCEVDVDHHVADVACADEVAAAVRTIAPEVVIHAASMQTWWLLDLFAPEHREVLARAGYGVWLPLHLTLAMTLMQGLSEAGYEGAVLNAAYPDVINVVLGGVGRAPAAGLGNVEELAAKVRGCAADRLAVPAGELDIWLVAHHALQRFAFRGVLAEGGSDGMLGTPGSGNEGVPPYFVRVEHRGVDVTEEAGARAALIAPCPLPAGPGWGQFSAAATESFVEALLGEAPSRLHAPGPAGLPGGYPVDAGAGKVALAAIPGLALDEAIDINVRSQRFDGIERIGEDGTVVFADDAAAAMHDALGYQCRVLPPADVVDRATELATRFREYAQRCGVDLGVAAP